MLQNQDGNILEVTGVNLSVGKISVTQYLNQNHYDNGDTLFVKRVFGSVSFDSEQLLQMTNQNLSSKESIILVLEEIIKAQDNTWIN